MIFADISNNQNQFDAAAYKAAGFTVISHKASQGNDFIDWDMVDRVRAAHAAGLQVWVYHFLIGDGAAEAHYFLNAVAPVMDLVSVLMLDYEANATAADATAFMETIEAANLGKQQVIYTGYYKITGTGLQHRAGWDWVVPDYNSTLNVGIPAGWPAAAYWQYTQTGTAAGIPGEVDLNRTTGAPLQQPAAPPATYQEDDMARIVQIPNDTREWVMTATHYYYLQNVAERNDLVRGGFVPTAVPLPMGRDTMELLTNLRPDLMKL